MTVTHEYNSKGYLAKLMHGETALVEVTAQAAHGQSKAESYGNGVETERTYDELGRLTDIDTTHGRAAIQDNAYAWRSDGSLERRTADAAGGRGKREESFDYDYLNRLTGATTYLADSTTASRTLAFDYDPRGNLKFKTSDVSADKSATGYEYVSGTNRLSEATIGDVEYRFTPDSSGHIEQYACWDDDEDGVDDCADVDDTFIEWNARGLAEKVTLGDSETDTTPTARDSFHYGPDGARYFKKTEWAVESGATTTMKTSRKYYAGAYETVTVGGDTVERTRIGDSVVHVRTTPASMMATPSSVFEYVRRDHLGSVEAVTDASGNELVVLGYDPYGQRRDNDWTARLTEAEIETLLGAHGERVSRGFTGHEHLDRTGLIHMNGRVYDPRLVRFLSPDPIVGDPTSSRSWNLYSYVGNNPLSYVDPTGLVQAGPCSAPLSGCMHFGGGAGGGSTTRTMTVTVHGVMVIPYRYAVPVWTEVGSGSIESDGASVWHQTYLRLLLGCDLRAVHLLADLLGGGAGRGDLRSACGLSRPDRRGVVRMTVRGKGAGRPRPPGSDHASLEHDDAADPIPVAQRLKGLSGVGVQSFQVGAASLDDVLPQHGLRRASRDNHDVIAVRCVHRRVDEQELPSREYGGHGGVLDLQHEGVRAQIEMAERGDRRRRVIRRLRMIGRPLPGDDGEGAPRRRRVVLVHPAAWLVHGVLEPGRQAGADAPQGAAARRTPAAYLAQIGLAHAGAACQPRGRAGLCDEPLQILGTDFLPAPRGRSGSQEPLADHAPKLQRY